MIIIDEIKRLIRRPFDTVILPFRRANRRQDQASVPLESTAAAPPSWALEPDPIQPDLFDAVDVDDGCGTVNSRV